MFRQRHFSFDRLLMGLANGINLIAKYFTLYELFGFVFYFRCRLKVLLAFNRVCKFLTVLVYWSSRKASRKRLRSEEVMFAFMQFQVKRKCMENCLYCREHRVLVHSTTAQRVHQFKENVSKKLWCLYLVGNKFDLKNFLKYLWRKTNHKIAFQ